MRIDAHSASCEYHPEQLTFGRFINHSKVGANLKPRLYTVDTDGEERDVIPFLATRDIEVEDELTFDYGVGKTSFGGEGSSLSWLS